MDFKDTLKILRKKHNFTQQQLAAKLNINRTSISKYENGIQIPEIDVLRNIANFFNVSMDYLLGDTNKLSNIPENISEGLSNKEKRDIAKDLDNFKEELLGSDSLMFDGEPLSDESVQSILSALEIGMQMVRQKNKTKYTPKKYRG